MYHEVIVMKLYKWEYGEGDEQSQCRPRMIINAITEQVEHYKYDKSLFKCNMCTNQASLLVMYI